MNDAFRQIFRPGLFQLVELRGEVVCQARLDLIGSRGAGVEQRTPAGNREIVVPA